MHARVHVRVHVHVHVHVLTNQAAHAYHARRAGQFGWNEVNMYVDGGVADGGLQQALARNLIGLLDMHGNGAKLDNIARKLRNIGLDAPKFTMNTEGVNKLDYWDPSEAINLRSWPYQIQYRD